MIVLFVWLGLLGAVLGLVLVCWICLKVEKAHPVRNFDERQQNNRGKAYRFSFWAGFIYNIIVMGILMFSQGTVQVEGWLIAGAGLMLQVMCFLVYSLITGAALPLSEKPVGVICADIAAGIVMLVNAYLNAGTYGISLVGWGSIVWLQSLLSVCLFSAGVMHLISYLIKDKE